MKNNAIKFSIIVPVYNVENYLRQCIDSILVQTYKNYEVILVDDGSTDYSSNICDTYFKEYSNIKVIHKKNGGLSNARNTGLLEATGKYIIFIDSDDFWVDKDFLMNINNSISDEDLIIFNSFKYYENRKNRKNRFKEDNFLNKLSEKNKIKYLIKKNIYKACAWDKVIKRDILINNNIKFPSDLLSEDMSWCGQLLEKVKKVKVYSKPVYAYRQRKNSISNKVDEKHVLDIIKQIEAGTNSNDNMILNYYAYEYCILLLYSNLLKEKKIY